ncbi:hypothetical protein SNE40_015487 [Patella caerulea]|uniref:Uncharacterized protein n=1 Tax=Patella caerulea TaxID=87958 RepID=A0AAN8PJB0_PATCE
MEAQKRPVQESNSDSSTQLCCSGTSSTKLAESAKLRMDTFTSWPHALPTPQSLCSVGFYYTGYHNGDEVRCSYCLRAVKNWSRTRIPFMEHYCAEQECPFVQKFREVVSTLPSMMDYSVHNPYYSQLINRERSFAGKESIFIPNTCTLALAKAGFYYQGPGDIVHCFCCHIELKNWERHDIPLGEHYKWSPDCLFLYTLLRKISQVIEIKKVDSYNPEPMGVRNSYQPWPTRVPLPENGPGEELVHSITNYRRQLGNSKTKSGSLTTLLASPKVQKVMCRTLSKSMVRQIVQKYVLSYPNDEWTPEELLLAVRVAEDYPKITSNEPVPERFQDGQESHGLSTRVNSDDQSTASLPCGHQFNNQRDDQDCPFCKSNQ